MGSLAFAQEGTQRWSFEAGSYVDTAPALSGEGIIYIGSWDDNVYAVQPDGTEQWHFDTGADVGRPLVVADDGTVYAANDDGQVYAFDPEGQLQWTFDPGTGRPVEGDMALGADGTLYVGIGVVVHAVLPTGNEFWSKEMEGTVRGLSIGIDGNIYVSTSSSIFIALSPSGDQQWSFDPGRGVDYPAAVAADGTIYLGTGDRNHDNFFALHPDGSLKWSANLGDNRNSPALAPDGSIYVPVEVPFTPQGFLVKVDPEDGSEIWRHEVDGSVTTTPAVGADGVVYFGTDSEKLFSVNADGTERWTFDVGHDTVCSPTIAPDGTLYLGSRESVLYAVRTSSQGLAASAWPKRQGDLRNTGQAGSDVSRGRWFAPHVFWLDEQNQAVITARHIGGSTGSSAGAPASFRVHLMNRDGSEAYVLEETIDPGASKDVHIAPPGGGTFIGSAVVDAPAVDSSFLAFFLTWNIEISAGNAYRVGAFFSRPNEAALIHHFPAESSARSGLGIAMQNIGNNQISCTLEFFTANGVRQSQETLDLEPLGSVVDFFDDRLPVGGFKGGATLACDAPVVAVAVTQDLDNGFPTDRITAKGGSQ